MKTLVYVPKLPDKTLFVNIVAFIFAIFVYLAQVSRKDYSLLGYTENLFIDKHYKIGFWATLGFQTISLFAGTSLSFIYKYKLYNCDIYIQKILDSHCFLDSVMAKELSTYNYPVITIFTNINQLSLIYLITLLLGSLGNQMNHEKY